MSFHPPEWLDLGGGLWAQFWCHALLDRRSLAFRVSLPLSGAHATLDVGGSMAPRKTTFLLGTEVD